MDIYEEALEGIEPLETTLPWLLGQGNLSEELTLYQQESYREPLTGEKMTAIRCICTVCTTQYYAQRVDAGGCARSYSPTPFGAFIDGEARIDGEELKCPYCSSFTRLHYSGRMRNDAEIVIGNQKVVEVRQVAGMLCIVQWGFYKECAKMGRTQIKHQPLHAFLLDGKKLIRLEGMQNFLGSWRYFNKFVRRKSYADTIGEAKLVAPWASELLIGTGAENSHLDIYIEAALNECRSCVPIGYLKAYLKSPNIENLLTSGAAKLLAEIIEVEHTTHRCYGTKNCTRVLQPEQLDLKEVRPARMLGLSTEGFRMALREGWSLRTVMNYRALLELNEPFDVARDLRAVERHGRWAAREMQERGLPVIKTMRYLTQQNQPWHMLKDYHRMMGECGRALDSQRLLYPKDLQQKHDELVLQVKYRAQTAKIEAFAASSKKYEYLQWNDGELCILLPQRQEDLIQEGNVLQHCVGGYVDSHIRGRIILFVRRKRRPERSYYTLNVDMTGAEPKRIQLHGYGNERHGPNKEYKHEIPKKVLDFVSRWEREVLRPRFQKQKKGA